MAAMAVGESIPDKLTKMNEIIKSKITGNEMSGEKTRAIYLQYLDIRLDLYFNSPKQNIITINAFSRGHYVRKNPEHRIMHRPSKEQEPASDKGDGALFLALTVLHCNNVFKNILCWTGILSDWWRIKGVCTIKDACKKQYGNEWYKKSSPKNDLFTDGHDKILEATFSQLKPDADRMPENLKKNGLTVMNILFFSLIDDPNFMEIYLEKENRKDKSMYGQGMDRPIGYMLKIVDEVDSQTNEPIDTFIMSYILFKQYDLLMMMDISLKNQHKEDGAKIIGIYSSLVYLYYNQK